MSAKIFYRFFSHMSETRMPLDTGDFRLLDRRVVDALISMPERDRFVRGMVSWLGFSQVAVPYHRASRVAGTTKFSLFKMVRLRSTAFSHFPFSLCGWQPGLDLRLQPLPLPESLPFCWSASSRCPA